MFSERTSYNPQFTRLTLGSRNRQQNTVESDPENFSRFENPREVPKDFLSRKIFSFTHQLLVSKTEIVSLFTIMCHFLNRMSASRSLRKGNWKVLFVFFGQHANHNCTILAVFLYQLFSALAPTTLHSRLFSINSERRSECNLLGTELL